MFFYVFKGDANPTYSPEFPRGALQGLFALNCLQVMNAPTVTVTLEGRADDGTSWSPIGVITPFSSIGVKTATISSLPQVLRYRFEVAGATSMAGAAIELYSPQWQS